MKLFRTLSLMFALVAAPAIASAGTAGMKPGVVQRDHRTVKPQPKKAQPKVKAQAKKHVKLTPAQRAMKKIERLDQDNNGALSLREVKGTRLEKRFDKLDTNNNNVLSRGELIQGIKDRRAHMKDKKGKGKGMHKGKGKGKGKNRGVRRGRVEKEA